MTTKIKGLKEIFTDYELKDIKDLGADLFVYSYEYGSYDGNGFAVWKKGKDWFYSGMSHCSCDGPTTFLKDANNAKFKWKDIEAIATENNYDTHAVDVVAYIKKKKLNV